MNIAEIKAALAAATPGPWKFNGNEVVAASKPRVGIAGAMSEEDCELIANAPQWLASLVSQVEAMQEELERTTKERDEAFELAANHFRALEQAKKERDGAKETSKAYREKAMAYRSELAAKDKALNEGIQKLISALDTRYKESIHKWNAEADMYAQGNADAYDMSEQLVISYLGSILSQYAITPAE